MKKIIIWLSLILFSIIFILIITKVKFTNKSDNNIEFNVENISFDIMNIDLEEYEFNEYSTDEYEKILKTTIKEFNNGGYSNYNDIDVQDKITEFKKSVDIKRYYDEVSKCIKHIKKEATFEEQKEIYYKADKDIILTLCDTSKDWSLLKISNALYDKMKKNKGILGNRNITSFYIDDNPPYKVQRTKLIYEKGNQKIGLIISKNEEYVYANADSHGSEIISDLIVEDTIYLTDTKGNYLDTRRLFTSENIKRNFEELCRDGDARGDIDYPDGEHYGYYGDDVAVSDNFRSKYPYFLDIFIHYSPLEYNKIILKSVDAENQTATFEVDSVLECKRRTYEVKYILDDRLYLDDVEVKMMKEEEYSVKPLGWKWTRSNVTPIYILIYKNSNYNLILSSDDFKNKYNNDNRVIDLEVKEWTKYWNLLRIVTNDDEIKYYYMKVITDTNEEVVYDIIINELNYGNISFEEAKNKYINEYGDRG